MSEGSYASGSEANLRIGFPQYRVLLYNTTGRAAAVNVWAYLTSWQERARGAVFVSP